MPQGCPIRGTWKRRQLWSSLCPVPVLKPFGPFSFSLYLIMLAFFLPHSPATSRRSQALNAVPSAVSEGKSHIGHHQKSLRGAAGVRDQHLSVSFGVASQGGGWLTWKGPSEWNCRLLLCTVDTSLCEVARNSCSCVGPGCWPAFDGV